MARVAAAPDLFLVAFHQPVGVEVVLDDGQAGFAGGADGFNDILGLRIGAGFTPDDVVEAAVDVVVAQVVGVGGGGLGAHLVC